MPSQPKAEATVAQVADRIEALQREIAAASEAVERTQDELQAAVIRGAGELDQQRAQKALTDAKARHRELEERAQLLDVALEEAMQREAEEQRQAKIRAADELLTERAAELAKLDSLLTQAGASIVRIAKLSQDVMATLPSRPGWVPPMFTTHGITQRLGFRLLALSEGMVRMHANLSTLWEAKQMPDLAARGQEERRNILEQYGVQADPPAPQKRGRAAGSKQ